LRTHEDIDTAIALITQSDADSLVSVMDVPHQFGLESLMVEEENRVKPVVDSTALTRQEKKQYVARNGPAILITRPETILTYQNLYGERIASYKMPTNRSTDIDSSEDLEYVSWLLSRD